MRPGPIEIKARHYYEDPGVRQTCHEVKQTSDLELQEQAVRKIAKELIGRNVVGPGNYLIPAPQHTGNAEYTKRIAELVARETGAVTADILRCVPHFSLYEGKKEGKPVHLELYLSGTIPAGRRCYFIDNVISTGRTFAEANHLFYGDLRPLVYAVDETRKRELLKNGLVIRPSVKEKLQNLKMEQVSDHIKVQSRARDKKAERM
jgi:hypothetical protein